MESTEKSSAAQEQSVPITAQDFSQSSAIFLADVPGHPEDEDDFDAQKDFFARAMNKNRRWCRIANGTKVDCRKGVVGFMRGGTFQLECATVGVSVNPDAKQRIDETVERGQQMLEEMSVASTKKINSKRKITVSRWSLDAKKSLYAQPPGQMIVTEDPVATHDAVNGANAKPVYGTIQVLVGDAWKSTKLKVSVPAVMAQYGKHFIVASHRGNMRMILHDGTSVRPKVVWAKQLALGDRYRLTRIIMTQHLIVAMMVVADCPVPALRFWSYDADSGEITHTWEHYITVNDFILRVVEHPHSCEHVLAATWGRKLLVLPLKPPRKMTVLGENHVYDIFDMPSRLQTKLNDPLVYICSPSHVHVALVPPPDHPETGITCFGAIEKPNVAHIAWHKGLIVMVTHSCEVFMALLSVYTFHAMLPLSANVRYGLDQKNGYATTMQQAIRITDDLITITFPNGAVRFIPFKA